MRRGKDEGDRLARRPDYAHGLGAEAIEHGIPFDVISGEISHFVAQRSFRRGEWTTNDARPASVGVGRPAASRKGPADGLKLRLPSA